MKGSKATPATRIQSPSALKNWAFEAFQSALPQSFWTNATFRRCSTLLNPPRITSSYLSSGSSKFAPASLADMSCKTLRRVVLTTRLSSENRQSRKATWLHCNGTNLPTELFNLSIVRRPSSQAQQQSFKDGIGGEIDDRTNHSILATYFSTYHRPDLSSHFRYFILRVEPSSSAKHPLLTFLALLLLKILDDSLSPGTAILRSPRVWFALPSQTRPSTILILSEY